MEKTGIELIAEERQRQIKYDRVMKLTSMTDFVLEQVETAKQTMRLGGVGMSLHIISNYAKFLKQPLTLGMFVPCDENNNPIGKNVADDNYLGVHLYQQAKERVLFEGFEFKNDLIFNASNQTFIDEEIIFNLENIENLINYYDDLTLTKTAIKQIGL